MKLQTYKCDNCQLIEVPTSWWKLLVSGEKNEFNEMTTCYIVTKHNGSVSGSYLYEFDLCSENCLAKMESQVREKMA